MGNIKRKTNRAGKTIVSFSDSSGKPIELVLRNDNLELRINGRYKNTLINDVTLEQAQIASEQYLKEYTDTATLNLQGQVNAIKNDTLGYIAYDAVAPTPDIPIGATKTYEFSTGGECAWITGGAVTVEKGDTVAATFTEPSTWVYTYSDVLKRKADATLIGDIDAVLGILTGDISGDIDLAIQEMQGV